ncbi:MAG: hypothetical protein E6625_20610 [Enterobacter asburiae]|jgi:hypothetical protein|nr:MULTISPECIES: hypothetical protein [Enterobacter]MDU6227949.1 hypothetical protein [Enterobacter asburiae]
MNSFFALIVTVCALTGNAQTSCSVYTKPKLAVMQLPNNST